MVVHRVLAILNLQQAVRSRCHEPRLDQIHFRGYDSVCVFEIACTVCATEATAEVIKAECPFYLLGLIGPIIGKLDQ